MKMDKLKKHSNKKHNLAESKSKQIETNNLDETNLLEDALKLEKLDPLNIEPIIVESNKIEPFIVEPIKIEPIKPIFDEIKIENIQPLVFDEDELNELNKNTFKIRKVEPIVFEPIKIESLEEQILLDELNDKDLDEIIKNEEEKAEQEKLRKIRKMENEPSSEKILDDVSDFLTVANIYKLLSDETRLKIFWILCHKKESVTNLSNTLNISSPAVAHHLKNLRESNLIQSEKIGKEVFYFETKSETTKILSSYLEDLMQLTCPNFMKMECLFHNKNNPSQIQQIHDYICDNLDKNLSTLELSNLFYINQTTLKNQFKQTYKTSIGEHIKEHRMEKAAELLKTTDKSIKDIASLVGYKNPSKFSIAFFNSHNLKPLDYRKKHKKF